MISRPSALERIAGLVEWLLLAGGLALFVALLAALGPGAVFAHLRTVGWGFGLIISAEILAYAANTLGWWTVFPRDAPAPPFRRLLLARIAGDAANYLTPTATLGGEFVRARMLQGHAALTSVVTSLAVAKLTQTLGLLTFLVVGLLLVLDETRLPPAARGGVLAGLGLFAAILAGLAVIQRRGMFGPVLRLAERWSARRFLASLRAPLERIDAEIARIHTESPARILLSAGAFALGFASGIIESYLILYFLGVPVTLNLALAVEVLGVAVNNLFFLVPMRLGTQEAGKAIVFAILGLDPVQGLAAGVVYRIRELTWALVGLGIFLAHRRRVPSPASAPCA